MYKRAAQALGKNMKQKNNSALSISKSSPSSSSSSDHEEIVVDTTGHSLISSSTQSVFEEMMNNASSPISEPAATTEVKDGTTVTNSCAPVIPTMQGHLNEFVTSIVVVGVGKGGGNAVNNMIVNQLHGTLIII